MGLIAQKIAAGKLMNNRAIILVKMFILRSMAKPLQWLNGSNDLDAQSDDYEVVSKWNGPSRIF